MTMEATHYWTGKESAPAIIWVNAVAPGKCKWLGDQCGRLYSPDGPSIGNFYRSRNGGWSVWTEPYAGCAYPEEVEVRACPRGDGCEFAHFHYPLKGGP